MNKISDSEGNVLVTQNFTDVGVIKVSLKLAREKRERLLGTINILAKELTVTRIRGKHLHVKSNSYGFNHYVLSKTRKFTHVRLIDDKGVYRIPVEEILAEGKFLFFKQAGIEKQIFYPLQLMEKYKV